METLTARLTRALKMDGTVYTEIGSDTAGTKQALLITGTAFAISSLRDPGGLVGNIIGGILGGIIGLLIWTGVVLLMGKAFSGQATYSELLRGIGYTSAPIALGIVPLLGILGLVYSIVMQIRVVRELHKISDGAAVAVVLIPFAVFAVIAVIIAIAVGAALFSLLANA